MPEYRVMELPAEKMFVVQRKRWWWPFWCCIEQHGELSSWARKFATQAGADNFLDDWIEKYHTIPRKIKRKELHVVSRNVKVDSSDKVRKDKTHYFKRKK